MSNELLTFITLGFFVLSLFLFIRKITPNNNSDESVEIDPEDAMAESELHMSYGKYKKAEQIIQVAIRKHPKNTELKLRLLEVFFISDNAIDFKSAAREFQVGLSDDDWDKVKTMGRQACKDEPMFIDKN